MTESETDATTLRIERLIPSPPDVLFALWTDPAQLARWWAPDGYDAEVETLDVRPGGSWRITLRNASGGALAMSGLYRVVEPLRRLVLTWAWETAVGTRDHETEVTVTFAAMPGGTRVVLVHRCFGSKDARDRHYAGWSSCFDRLARLAE